MPSETPDHPQADRPRPDIVQQELPLVEHVSARQRRGRPKPKMDLQMTSMIDVIFLLLIYFVVTASFVQDEGVLTTKLPDIGESSNVADPFELSSELVIELEQADSGRPDEVQIIAGGKVLGTFTELFDYIQGEQDNPAQNRLGTYATDDPVKIKPGVQVRWQHVVNAMNAAVRADYTNVQFMPARP